MSFKNILRDRKKDKGRVTCTELFFDLVFVLAIIMISHRLVGHFDLNHLWFPLSITVIGIALLIILVFFYPFMSLVLYATLILIVLILVAALETYAVCTKRL